ncbi:MAG: hypothetical protein OXI87_23540 [Albidovulum sp.]|nr:hypothetical protein [Albidovulum sp.]
MSLDCTNAAILAAHSAGDGASLAGLYRRAGDEFIAAGSIDEGCFYLTQAYVYSLEYGLDSAAAIRSVLVAHGRER